MKTFIIKGEKIDLGMISQDAIPGIIDFYERNRDRIAMFNPPLPEDYFTAEYWKKKLRYQNSSLKREKSVDFYLFLPDRPEKVVGHIRLFNIESTPRCSCEAGYTIDSLLEGRGYMFEALSLALSFAKNGLRLHRMTAECHPDNLKSRNLLLASGFREEGTSYESMWLRDCWQDMIRYSCIL